MPVAPAAEGSPAAGVTGLGPSAVRLQENPLSSLAQAASLVTFIALLAGLVVFLARGIAGAFPFTIAIGATAACLLAAMLGVAGTAIGGGRRRRTVRTGVASKPADPRPAAVGSPATASPATTPLPWPDARLLQRIERFERSTAGGSTEAALGRVVARFEQGTRTAVVHVGFCPPFTATPLVDLSTECDGLEVTLSAAEILPWGVRIEGRLEEPAEEPIDVEIDLTAEPPAVPAGID